MRFIWNYKGHNNGFFNMKQNWIQITFPPSRKRRRCSLIITYRKAKGDRT